MNIDNMLIFGVMIDYGLFGFVDVFDVNYICNYFDIGGCYVYWMQLCIVYWNCYCFVQVLLLLIGLQYGIVDDDVCVECVVDDVQVVFVKFLECFGFVFECVMCVKFGFVFECEGDVEFVNKLFEMMYVSYVDFMLMFCWFVQILKYDVSCDVFVCDFFIDCEVFDVWVNFYCVWLFEEMCDDVVCVVVMNCVNFKYVFCNYLVEVVIWCVKEKDFLEVEWFVQILCCLFDE